MTLELSVTQGRLRGHLDEGIPAFFGIPYGSNPSGELRFQAPLPAPPWSGVREASEFGPIAPQPAALGGFAIPGDPSEQSEDCLSLNVWTPSIDGPLLPVMFFIHGGSFTSGTGASLVYRGGVLAGEGNVVVVTINYRLGALGFLGHAALQGKNGSLGNFGLMDQVLALEWVRDNIASFGGDAKNVTIFGESAGAMSVCALLASPTANGLFHKAIVQSGPPVSHRRDQSLTRGDQLAEILGLTSPTRSDFESIPAARFVEAVNEFSASTPEPGEVELPLLPTIDGVFLPGDPLSEIENGSVAHVPLMTGTTRDEMTMFSMGDPKVSQMGREELLHWLKFALPGCDPESVLEAFISARTQRGEAVDPPALWVAMSTEAIFRAPTVHLAEAHSPHAAKTFLYLFTQETPIFGGILGSCHALELPFVFGSIRNEFVGLFSGNSPESQELSEQMIAAWSSFARDGVPSVSGIWSEFDHSRRPTQIFGPEGGQVENPRSEELDIVSAALQASQTGA